MFLIDKLSQISLNRSIKWAVKIALFFLGLVVVLVWYLSVKKIPISCPAQLSSSQTLQTDIQYAPYISDAKHIEVFQNKKKITVEISAKKLSNTHVTLWVSNPVLSLNKNYRIFIKEVTLKELITKRRHHEL